MSKYQFVLIRTSNFGTKSMYVVAPWQKSFIVLLPVREPKGNLRPHLRESRQDVLQVLHLPEGLRGEGRRVRIIVQFYRLSYYIQAMFRKYQEIYCTKYLKLQLFVLINRLLFLPTYTPFSKI